MYVFVIHKIETETGQSNATCMTTWMMEYTKVEVRYKISTHKNRGPILITETINSNHYVWLIPTPHFFIQ